MAGLRLIIAAGAAALASQACAGETACWFDAGVVVVPASVAGVVGDYILDTGAPQTLLDETRAQAAGFEETSLSGEVQLAGVAIAGRPVAVQGLDVRTWNLPTPVAGVIGVDVLKAYVLDVSFAPCRVRLSLPRRAPRFRGGRTLSLGWDAGSPVAAASAGDGERKLRGPFVVATGVNVPARLADDVASAPGAAKPEELYPDGVGLARLPRLDFGGRRLQDLAAGLMKPQGETAGVLGGGALAAFRLRFDFPGGKLIVAPP